MPNTVSKEVMKGQQHQHRKPQKGKGNLLQTAAPVELLGKRRLHPSLLPRLFLLLDHSFADVITIVSTGSPPLNGSSTPTIYLGSVVRWRGLSFHAFEFVSKGSASIVKHQGSQGAIQSPFLCSKIG